MARRFAKRTKGSFTRRTGKMFGKSKRFGSKRRVGGGKRKFSKPSTTFAKRVKKVLYKQVETKKVVCYMPSSGGVAPFNLKGKEIKFLGVDPLVSSSAAYNLLERRNLGTASVAAIGGDPATLISTTARIYGDSVLGDEMMPTSIRIRAEFRSAIWAPPSRTMVMLVMGNAGDTPALATLFRNQTYNCFLDDFNYPRFQLIGKKVFTLGGVSMAMNKNADEHKPGGSTGASASTGTYWNVDGVSALADPQEAEMTENTVKFNGASNMQAFAPKVYLMDWTCSLKKVGKVVYNGGTYTTGGGAAFNTPAVIPKQKALWLLAYNYANNLQGESNVNANVFVDEIHWKLHFKDL